MTNLEQERALILEVIGITNDSSVLTNQYKLTDQASESVMTWPHQAIHENITFTSREDVTSHLNTVRSLPLNETYTVDLFEGYLILGSAMLNGMMELSSDYTELQGVIWKVCPPDKSHPGI